MRVNYVGGGNIFSRVGSDIRFVERGEKEDERKKEGRKEGKGEYRGGGRKRLSARLRVATSGMDNA